MIGPKSQKIISISLIVVYVPIALLLLAKGEIVLFAIISLVMWGLSKAIQHYASRLVKEKK
ncbi:MAG: hypothetical protein ACQESC_02590 [Nanobdellota archaeon]